MIKTSTVGMLPELAIPAIEELKAAHVQKLYEALVGVIHTLNGGLRFGDGSVGTLAGNFSVDVAEVAFPDADAAVTFRHSLGRVPIGYLVFRRSAACVIYDELDRSWTEKTMRLLSDTADVTARILVL